MPEYKIDSKFLKYAFMSYFRFNRNYISCDECLDRDVIADTGKEIIEVEIKVSKYDLLKLEKKKVWKHESYKRTMRYGYVPNRFYFGVTQSLKEAAEQAIKEIGNEKYGIIVFDEKHFERVRGELSKRALRYVNFQNYVHIARSAKKLTDTYDSGLVRQIAKRASASLISKQEKLIYLAEKERGK